MSDSPDTTKAPNRPFRPYPPKLTEQVSRHVDSLMEAVWPWITKRRERKDASTQALVNNDDAELRAHLASALMNAAQSGGAVTWDGFLIAQVLRTVHSWPCDAWLVSIVHRWSCETAAKEWQEYQARKEKGGKGQ